MLIPSFSRDAACHDPSLSRRVNANSQLDIASDCLIDKLIKKGEC